MVETAETDRTLLQQWQTLSREYAELPRKAGEVQGTRKKEVLAQAVPLFKTLLMRRVQSFKSGTYPTDTLLMECLKQTTSLPVIAPYERAKQLIGGEINHLVITQPDEDLILFYRLSSLGTWWGYVRFGFTNDNLPPGKKLKDMPLEKVYWRINANELSKYKKLHGLSTDEMEMLERSYEYLYMYPVKELILLPQYEPSVDSEIEIGPIALSKISRPEDPKDIEPLPLEELTRDYFRACEDSEIPSWEKYLRKLWRELNEYGIEDEIVEAYNALLREAWFRGVGVDAEEVILAGSTYVSPMHVGPERITPDYLEKLTKEDLLLLHARLHVLYNTLSAAGKDTDMVVKAHILLLKEFARRGMEHRAISAIDEIGVVEDEDPPNPEEDVKNFFTSRPYAYLVGSTAVLGFGRDFDVLIRDKVNLNFEVALQRILGDKGGKVHAFSDPAGPFTNYMPLYSMGYFRDPREITDRVITPLSFKNYEVDEKLVELNGIKAKLLPLFEPAPCVWYSLESDEEKEPKFPLKKEEWQKKLPKDWKADRILFEIADQPMKYDLTEFTAGLVIEREHGPQMGKETDVTHDDPILTGKIVLAHLKEIPDYYTRLIKMEAEAEHCKSCSQVHYHIIGNEQDKALEFRLRWQTKGRKPLFHYVTAPPADAKPLLTRGWIPEEETQLVTLGKEEEREGDVSAKEDEVKLMRFFYPMKPKMSVEDNEPQTPEALVEAFDDADFPVYSTKKFDGLNTEIHKQGDEIKIISDDGEDITHRFPGIVARVKEMEGDLVILAEIEWWSDKHPEIMSREENNLSCYIGSKRVFAEKIVNTIPDGCKTLFDPMCGSGKVLLEAKKRGIQVYGSDVNPIAGYLTKAALSGKAISREDFEKILNAKPYNGYFSKLESPSRLKKISKKVKNYLDGMVKVVHSFEGERKMLAMGWMAGFLSTMQANVAFGSVPERAWNLPTMKRRAEAIFREMQRYAEIEGPPGKILVKDINNRDIPKVDVVYFDPPYDSKYLSSSKDPLYRLYNLAASVLLQEKFEYPDFEFNQVPEIIGKLSEEAKPKVFMISSDAKSKTPYKEVLKNLGYEVKMKRFRRDRMHHGPGPLPNRSEGKMPAESLYYGVRKVEDSRKLDAEPTFEDILETERTVKHFPREFISGYVHAKTEPDDSEMVANVYDVVYKDEDIHKKPFNERLEVLENLGIEQSTMDVPDTSKKLNKVPALKADSKEELAEHNNKVVNTPGSEGDVAKPANSLYSLKPGISTQYKYHKAVVINAIVLTRDETATDGVYTYEYGVKPGKFEVHPGDRLLLNDEEYAKIGTTFSTKDKFEPGDMIKVEVETLNFGEHPENKIRLSGWVPRVLGAGEELDDIGQAKDRAEENGVLVHKRYSNAGLPKVLTQTEDSLIKKVAEYDATEVSDKVLSDDWRIANAWWSNFKEDKKVEHSEETILNLGRKIFRELVRRGDITFHPESLSKNALDFLETILQEEADTRGFILKDAELIGEGKKRAIVRSRPFEFDGFHSLAGTDGKVWGWVRFGFTKENTPEGVKPTGDTFIIIDEDEFKRLRKYHWINDSEKEQWWPGNNKLYFHPIREFVPYSGDYKIDVPENHNGYVKGMFIEEQVGAFEAHEYGEITDVKLSVSANAKTKTEVKKWRSLSRQKLASYNPRSLPEYFFHLANHFRGETCHMDFRYMCKGRKEARGFTIAHQKAGAIKEPIESLTAAAKISKPSDRNYWKFTPDAGAGTHVMAFEKGKMAPKWLTMVRNVEEPGEVGATEQYPGVFFGVDWGVLAPGVLGEGRFGTSKPWFREFFLFGSDFKGRLVFRMVENAPDWEKAGKENVNWQAWMAKDQTPYIMTARARREKDYIPPEGISGLPPQLEDKVPAELRWWTPDVKSKEEAFKRMDETRKIFMEKDYIGEGVEFTLAEKTGEYRLQYFWSKGQKSVRNLRNEQFVLRLNRDGEETSCYFKDDPHTLRKGMAIAGVAEETPGEAPEGDWFDYEGDLPPEHPANPYKELPMHVEILSRGKFEILEADDDRYVIRFMDGRMIGKFLLTKEQGDSEFWKLQKV